MAKELIKPSEVAISLVEKNRINIQLTDSYYYIQSLKQKYSSKKDTIFLFVKKSTLANVFSKTKLGDKIIDIDTNVKVISYCGTNELIGNLPVYKGQAIEQLDEIK